MAYETNTEVNEGLDVDDALTLEYENADCENAHVIDEDLELLMPWIDEEVVWGMPRNHCSENVLIY